MGNEINWCNMIYEENNSAFKFPSTLGELIDVMERHPDMYEHLKIFLGRESNTGIPDFGEQYLAVSHDGFALYRLDSVDYQNFVPAQYVLTTTWSFSLSPSRGCFVFTLKSDHAGAHRFCQ